MTVLILTGAMAQRGTADMHTVTAPMLAAGSGFQFGPRDRLFSRVQALPIRDLRDGVLWRQIETQPGIYDPRSASGISQIAGSHAGSLTIFPQNPIYEDGDTVVGPDGIRAFARFAAELAKLYPDLPAIEVANEFNSTSFVRGAAKEMTPLERADLHARHLAALTQEPALAGRRILGGAAHSVAAGYIWRMLDAGAGAHMDAVTVHPYTSAPEDIPRQLDVLRRHPGMRDLDIEVTEFGTQDEVMAADFFWRMYCTMALASVHRAVWYPLEGRGDGYTPILSTEFALTGVGRAFLHAQELAGQPVRTFRPDPFTFGCQFGAETAVIWGVERTLSLKVAGYEVRSADMGLYKGVLTLSPDRVLVLTRADGAIDMEADLDLSGIDLLADSFYQFFFPANDDTARGRVKDGFDRFLRVAEQTHDFTTCPGQEAPQKPWFPYLCSDVVKRFVLHSRGFAWGGNAQRPVQLVHRFVPNQAGDVRVEVDVTMQPGSRDGLRIWVESDQGQSDPQILLSEGSAFFGPLPAAPGRPIDIVLDPNGTPIGDVGQLRLRVFDAEPAFEPAD